MTEDRLQFDCVKWFHNSVTEERGFLCRTENKTNKGARDLGLGMVKGMSDLRYTDKNGTTILFELKAQDSRHDVKKLKEQLNFIERHELRGAVGFFIFELDQFKTVMANIVPSGINDLAIAMSNLSKAYIKRMIGESEKINRKTVELHFNYKGGK